MLVGGAPLRILRLADRGVTALDRLVAGATLAGDPAAASLARRLTDAGSRWLGGKVVISRRVASETDSAPSSLPKWSAS